MRGVDVKLENKLKQTCENDTQSARPMVIGQEDLVIGAYKGQQCRVRPHVHCIILALVPHTVVNEHKTLYSCWILTHHYTGHDEEGIPGIAFLLHCDPWDHNRSKRTRGSEGEWEQQIT